MRSTPARDSRPAHRRARGTLTGNQVTLLELVTAVAEVTTDEREIVATVMYMLRSGHVRLAGNFRDEPVERF